MKSIARLSLVLLLLGCQSKSGSDSKQDSTRVDSTSQPISTGSNLQADEALYGFSLAASAFSALVLSGTSLSTDSTEISDVATYLGTLRPAIVLSQSALTYPAEAELCDRNTWYQVQLDDQQGWVTGDRLLQKTGAPTWQDNFEYAGKNYTVGFLRPATPGASNAQGLTGCTEYAVLYFMDEAGKKIHFLKGDASPLEAITGSYSNWFSLLSGEAGGGSITSLESGDGQNEVVRLHLRYGYQEGGGQAILHVEYKDGIFSVVSLEQREEIN